MDGGVPVMSDDVTSTDVGDEDNVEMGSVLVVDSVIPISHEVESFTCKIEIKTTMLEEFKCIILLM